MHVLYCGRIFGVAEFRWIQYMVSLWSHLMLHNSMVGKMLEFVSGAS